MTLRRVAFTLALVAVAGVGAWIGVPKGMARLEYFRVRQIEVAGLRFLDERDVVRRLALPNDASVVDPLDDVRRRAGAIPGLAAVSVERRLPGTLRVLVLEELPVAFAMQEDRLVLIDRLGRVLPFEPADAPMTLPIATRDSTTASLLAAVLRADPVWYGTIEVARRDGSDVLLEDGIHRVRVRPDATLETLRAVTAVRDWLANASRDWRELDARFEGRMFVKRGQS